jgi:hypothetical protein
MAVEEPRYDVTLRDGAFEVRDYPALVAAQVQVDGDQDKAGNSGFRLLAGYIFGGNERRESIAMTAPVVQSKGGGEKIPMTAPVTQTLNNGLWTVRFIMPRGYTIASLPVPNDARVKLVPIAPARIAVLRFSGLAFEHDVAERTDELRSFLAKHELHPAGPASLARYDPPWTLWFLRRNEIMIPLQADISH